MVLDLAAVVAHSARGIFSLWLCSFHADGTVRYGNGVGRAAVSGSLSNNTPIVCCRYSNIIASNLSPEVNDYELYLVFEGISRPAEAPARHGCRAR